MTAGKARQDNRTRINGGPSLTNIDLLRLQMHDEAEALLCGILHRKRFTADLRDALAEALVRIVTAQMRR